MTGRYLGLDKIQDRRQEKIFRRFIKDHCKKRNNRDINRRSLMDCGRQYYDVDDYEHIVEYGFFPEHIESEEDAMEYFDYYTRRTICSPYDCTGKLFTAFIKIHKNPCGRFSFIHDLYLDV